MKRTAILTAVGLALTAASSSTPASATFVRTFVSGTGSDSNPCTRTQPCQTFAFAITQTAAGGEIDVLDPGGYGPVSIAKAISIVNDGVGTVGVKAVSGGTAITINAGSSDAVSLRGLTVEGAGVGATGVAFNAGQSLTIENCVIRNFTGEGIAFYPNASSNLSVSNSLVANNGDASIYVHPSGSGVVRAVMNHAELNNNNNNGIIVDGTNSTGTINAAVSESVAANNANNGFGAVSNTGHAPTTLTLFHSVAANNNGTGLVAEGQGAILRAAQSMVTGNFNDWLALSGGLVQSYTDNYIDGNTNSSGTPPSVAKK